MNNAQQSKNKAFRFKKKGFQFEVTHFRLRFSAPDITGTELAYVLHVQHAVYPKFMKGILMILNIYTFTEFLVSFWKYDTIATTSQMTLV